MIREIAVLALGSVFLSACAAMPDNTPYRAHVTSQQAAYVGATCSKVMRLDPGEAEYEGCVSDLSDVMVAQSHYARELVAYHSCGAQGLTRDTPQYSRCVLDREQAPAGVRPAKAPLQLDVAAVTAADNSPRDYYESNFDLRRRREEYACAQLGLEPGSDGFVSCANNLETDLFNIAHPQG